MAFLYPVEIMTEPTFGRKKSSHVKLFLLLLANFWLLFGSFLFSATG
jgi:hypothetical protein